VCRKDGMANEIAGFGDLILFYFFFVVLSELIVKCVIGFRRFVRMLEN
jgi:hypothetical protein